MAECPKCQHAWVEHAGTSPWLVTGCGSCIAEEDAGERADVCDLFAPDGEQGPAGRRLHARLRRRRWRTDLVLIEDEDFYLWAQLSLSRKDEPDSADLLESVQEDLAVLPLIAFARKYRRWMTDKSFATAIADR